MSLINQMLKDLEHRRSQDHQGSESVIPGVRRYSVATRQHSPWPIILSIVILGLASVVGYLLWERYNTIPVVEAPSAVEIAKPEESSIPAGPVTHLKKQPVANTEPVAVVHPVNKIQPDKVVTKKKDPAHVIAKKESNRSIKNNQQDEVSTAAGSARVKKVSRPLNPKQQSEVLYQNGYGLLAAGRSSEGEQALRKALTLYPEHVKAREVLAGLYIKAGRVIEAGDLLQQGLVFIPGHVLFAKIQARLLLDQGKTQQAIEVLEKNAPAINSQPDYHALMAAAYQRDKQHAMAVDKYSSVLTISPAAGVWWIGMAISLEALGRQDEARQAYQQAKKTGHLAVDLVRYTDNRLSALRESGFPPQKTGSE